MLEQGKVGRKGSCVEELSYELLGLLGVESRRTKKGGRKGRKFGRSWVEARLE